VHFKTKLGLHLFLIPFKSIFMWHLIFVLVFVQFDSSLGLFSRTELVKHFYMRLTEWFHGVC